MQPMPRDASLDNSLALLKEGYNFVGTRCKRLESDVFATRLLLQKTVCMQGEEAAKLFYGGEHFTRRGALPWPVQRTLTGEGAVMLTDGARHRGRKQTFMSLMTPERLGDMANLFAEEWAQRIPLWQKKNRILLFDEMQEILFSAVCKWSGVPVPESDIGWRTFEFGILIDGAGGVGPRHWQARSARKSAERWITNLVQQVRAGELTPPIKTALHAMAFHRDPEGGLLDARIAAVELINVLRPTVAVSWFITFAASALHQHPDSKKRIASDEEGYLDCFIQEVRRFYAFFPLVAARVREDFDWKGYQFTEGTRVLLDLYGTCHDARIWIAPERFDPERFRNWNGNPFNFIPQGGGDFHTAHRCAGEWMTIELMRVAVLVLAKHLVYRVPPQDLSIDLRRMPMITKSHFIMEQIRLKH
jgi:fatty-acid peroxygenase